MNNTETIRRITEMEALFDSLQDSLQAAPDTAMQDPLFREKLKKLTDYYESKQWRQDYEADEQGLLPAGLKRGILSEDGIYNFLTELPPPCTLRKAAAEDFPTINKLFNEMMHSIYGRTDAAYDEKAMAYYFSGGEDWICLAEADDAIVGFLSMEVHREEKTFIYLDDLAVTTAYRKRGIGSTLLDRAEAYAQELGISVLVLHVEQDNRNARPLYESRGFRQNGAVGTRLRMIKEL